MISKAPFNDDAVLEAAKYSFFCEAGWYYFVSNLSLLLFFLSCYHLLPSSIICLQPRRWLLILSPLFPLLFYPKELLLWSLSLQGPSLNNMSVTPDWPVLWNRVEHVPSFPRRREESNYWLFMALKSVFKGSGFHNLHNIKLIKSLHTDFIYFILVKG